MRSRISVSSMKPIGIYGLGPVAMVTGRLLDLAGIDYFFIARRSKRGLKLKSELPASGIKVSAIKERDDLQKWNGQVIAREVYFLDEVRLDLETLFICSPHSSFQYIFQSLLDRKIKHIKSIILANSGLGRSSEVFQYFPKANLTCFSNFFGAAKYQSQNTVLLKNIKNEVGVYASSLAMREFIQEIFGDTGVSLSFTQTALEAEFQNITLYAHPAFSTSAVCLRYSLGISDVKKYMYKTFPEGPVEPRQTVIYASFADLIQQIMTQLGSKRFNVLSFLHDKNYKVLDCYLNRDEIDSYPTLSLKDQGKLIFSRYIGLLVDSNSTPDDQGRYFDFSAVLMPRVCYDKNQAHLPRILSEDIYHIFMIYYFSLNLSLDSDSDETIAFKLVENINTIVNELDEKRRDLVVQQLKSIKEIAHNNVRLVLGEEIES